MFKVEHYPVRWQKCPVCNGLQGFEISENTGGSFKVYWQTCKPCSGTGIISLETGLPPVVKKARWYRR